MLGEHLRVSLGSGELVGIGEAFGSFMIQARVQLKDKSLP